MTEDERRTNGQTAAERLHLPPELFQRLAEAFRHIRDLDRFLELLAGSIREMIDVQDVRIRLAKDEIASEAVSERHGELRIEDSEVCVPLALRGRMVGTLHLLQEGEQAPFHPQDLFLISALSDFIAAVMEHAVTSNGSASPLPAPSEAGERASTEETKPAQVVVLHPRDPVATALKWALQPDCRVAISQTADDLYQRLRLQQPRAVILPLDLVLPPAADVIAASRELAPGLLVIGLMPPGNGDEPIPPDVQAVIHGASDVAAIRSVVLGALTAESEN
jgi:hypothetical protein